VNICRFPARRILLSKIKYQLGMNQVVTALATGAKRLPPNRPHEKPKPQWPPQLNAQLLLNNPKGLR
jgi:hypothetical protein